MGYIDKNLLPDEQIVFRTGKNRIIFFYPFVWTAFSVYATYLMLTNPILAWIVWTPWVLAVVFWAVVWLEYVTSDFAVTNRRVMMREGFFTRHANEVRIATISQVNVDQSLLGQLFNYGTVSIHTFGAFDAYTMIASPGLFQRAVNSQLDKIAK